MKNIISMTLALALVLSLSIPAFASELGGSKDVTAVYKSTTTEDPVHSVEQIWDDLTFTYTETTTKTWNADTHTYEKDTVGRWDKNKANITLVNHSNVEVKVTMSVVPVAGTGLNVTLTGGNATLAAGVENDVEGAASVTGVLTVSGTPNDTVTAEGIKVASITVTVE